VKVVTVIDYTCVYRICC